MGDKFVPRMDITSKPGTHVIFDGLGGYPSEKKYAESILTLNHSYEVERIDIGSFSSTVKLKGFSEFFNTCLFAAHICPPEVNTSKALQLADELQSDPITSRLGFVHVAAEELRRLSQSEKEGWQYAKEMESHNKELLETQIWQEKTISEHLNRIAELELTLKMNSSESDQLSKRSVGSWQDYVV